MKQELICANNTRKKSVLDPRTKLLMLIMVSAFVLGSTGGERTIGIRYIFTLFPFLFLALEGKWKSVIRFSILFTLGMVLEMFLNRKLSGLLGFVILGSCGILTQFLPGMMMGYYALSTTTVSEFIAAMQRLHITDKITIPLSVMFRFFPTVLEEYTSIKHAMKMRGIGLGNGNFAKIVEYRMVPVMTCSVRIGEELSAAALTRGLGGTATRTNICKIGFGVLDYVVWLCSISAVIWLVIGLF
ncbi:ABC-type cobalt transport system, permease component CbiQ and related transporters [Lachnospiraceae bacterium KM106-2]|nr:ABC-type cobalt transport system, permease component CbiQ and related transporters [Lachnospiraceae bacterium KM106-2]